MVAQLFSRCKSLLFCGSGKRGVGKAGLVPTLDIGEKKRLGSVRNATNNSSRFALFQDISFLKSANTNTE